MGNITIMHTSVFVLYFEGGLEVLLGIGPVLKGGRRHSFFFELIIDCL